TVERHHSLLRTAIETHNGVLFKTVGDAVQAAFPTAPDAVAAALDAQRSLATERWTEVDGALAVRMAVHTTAAEPHDGDYLAPGLNRLARLVSAAHGGQVLLTLVTQNLAHDALPLDASLRDLGEHPLRDLDHPQRVFQLLHPDLADDFPPIRSLATGPNNLPGQLTPFFGREEQVARVVDLLGREDVRLLTITGPGGVGKTRVALQAAADVLEHFADGVWFVDLSVLDDSTLVPPAIAGVLGVRDEGSGLTERLAGALAAKRLLLVLDNFERVLEAAPFVTSLLARAPGLKVLVTSRAPMHTYGEQEFPLAPFLLPDSAPLLPLEQVRQLDAVRLFVERAQAVKPDFTVTAANASAIAEICHRLDGLPLAIELAAALIRMLSPQALLMRLEKRLPLLTRGGRDVPARQQTMRDAIDWSHDLLTREEQALFQSLAVFVGGFTLDAAEAVALPEATLDVFDGVASLVDKSLLRQKEVGGEPRFRMLETVREFALERLEESGQGEESRRRLAAWCLALAEAAQPDLIGGSMHPRWVVLLDNELPNIRAAVNWLLERGEGRTALRLLTAIEDYWSRRRPNTVELCRWLTAALAAAPEAPAADRTVAHYLLALVNSTLGNEEDAAMHAQRLLSAARESGEPAALGLAQYGVGMVWEFHGHSEQAAAALTEAIPLLQGAGNAVLAAWAQADLADILVWRGELAAGVPMLDEALARLRQIGSDWLILLVLNQRGHAALAEEDLPRAAGCFAESITEARSTQQTRTILGAVHGLAGVALALGQPERAARLLGAVGAAREALGMGRISQKHHGERITADTRAALEAAAFEEAWTAGRVLTVEEAVAEALAIADLVVTEAKG
ncbi:MAG: adenylate/guanylate cyclase protein, partial [Thermomicrobiales bacterium]|nr:adenylate/guanylate cyclase protein [Thermomicrobiales bacterium]